MSARDTATCTETLRFLRANLGRQALAPLTGTDYRALAAAIHIVSLYTYGGGNDATLQALRLVVMQMQPSTRHLAYHAIAHGMDWNDRARVWALAQLPPMPEVAQRCANEP